jgi:hypothetical protein
MGGGKGRSLRLLMDGGERVLRRGRQGDGVRSVGQWRG